MRLHFDDGSFKDLLLQSLTSGNRSIAKVIGNGSTSIFQLDFEGAGSTKATVGRFECVLWALRPDAGGSHICECMHSEWFFVQPDVKGLALPKFIWPPVVFLANDKTKQLVSLDAQCNDLPRFPDGTTFQTKKSTGTSGSTIATISTGLLTGKATPGLVFAEVTLPNGSLLNGCTTGSQSIVQVGPMTIYLRFLADTVTYMKASFPGQGLALTDAEVLDIKAKAVTRVQNLFNAVTANVTVRHTAPPPTKPHMPWEWFLMSPQVKRKPR